MHGGPDGIFFASATPSVVALARENGAAPGKRVYCSFQTVAHNDDTFAWVAGDNTPDCAGAAPGTALFVWDNNTVPQVKVAARIGGPTSIPGTTFTAFIGTPAVDAEDRVVFRAGFTGAATGTGIFRWDNLSNTLSTVVVRGDAAPDTTGLLNQVRESLDVVQFAPPPFPGPFPGPIRIFLRSTIRSGSAKSGFFLFDPGGSALVLGTDDVPDDLFDPAARYEKLLEFGVDPSGMKLGFVARVRDAVAPAAKTGVLRCDVP